MHGTDTLPSAQAIGENPPEHKTRVLTLVLKVILAANLLLFGLNKFFLFLPEIEMAPKASLFFQQLFDSGYLMQLTGAVEVLAAIGLFFKRTAPLALLALVPISVNIVAFHLFLDVATILPAAIVASLNAILLYWNREKYRALFA